MKRAPWFCLLVCVLSGMACSGGDRGVMAVDSGTGPGGNAGSSAAGGGISTAGSGGVFYDSDGGVIGIPGAGWTVPPELQLCNGACQCADGMDNDGDGEADGFDTECVSAGDNDEGSFATGISGDNMDPKWQDCFFDGNSGAGDDDCRYATECLTAGKEQTDPDCMLTKECIEFCKPLAPNGCDCFGCCEVRDEKGDTLHIVLEPWRGRWVRLEHM